MASFEDLIVWQKAHQLVMRIYELSNTWPRNEMYCLVPQVRRAAVSIPANIAEGSAKRGPKEFRRYLDIAIGSRSEVKYLLRLAADLGYINAVDKQPILEECEEVGRLLWGLYRSIKSFT